MSIFLLILIYFVLGFLTLISDYYLDYYFFGNTRNCGLLFLFQKEFNEFSIKDLILLFFSAIFFASIFPLIFIVDFCCIIYIIVRKLLIMKR